MKITRQAPFEHLIVLIQTRLPYRGTIIQLTQRHKWDQLVFYENYLQIGFIVRL